MMIDDDMVHAWLDGALAPAEAARIERLVAQDPDLAARVARQRAIIDSARAAFDADLDIPAPDAWIERIDAALLPAEKAKIVSLASAREARRAGGRQNWRAGAIAASLIAGLALGQFIPRGPSGLIRQEGGVVLASAPLAEGLSRARSGVPQAVGDQTLDIRLSLRTAAGGYCREAMLSGGAATQHLLACRDGDDWRIDALLKAGGGKADGYAMAAGDSGAMESILDALGGEALDRTGEARAVQDRWRAQK